MRFISYFFLLLIVIFGMTFSTLNSDSVTIDYYFYQSSMPLSLLLVIVFAMGCLLGMVVGIWLLIKAKMVNYRLSKRLSVAEKEISNLRTMPLQDNV